MTKSHKNENKKKIVHNHLQFKALSFFNSIKISIPSNSSKSTHWRTDPAFRYTATQIDKMLSPNVCEATVNFYMQCKSCLRDPIKSYQEH